MSPPCQLQDFKNGKFLNAAKSMEKACNINIFDLSTLPFFFFSFFEIGDLSTILLQVIQQINCVIHLTKTELTVTNITV